MKGEGNYYLVKVFSMIGKKYNFVFGLYFKYIIGGWSKI